MADETWQFAQFPAPDGAQDAAAFLNVNARQGRGEASATLRNDGTAGLLYLEPGSLGAASEPSWLIADFPAPGGAQDAATFLNENPRQGDGEASATLRSDGSAGLLYLEPGSLGESTAQAWQYKDFPGPDGEQAAIALLNASPRQQAGEATGFVRNDGSAVILYLEPGSGS
jgi:hypothetical protein